MIPEINRLPSIRMPKRLPLPNAPGIYFVVSGGNVQYIGRTVSLSRRLKAHHRQADFEQLRGARVAWMLLDSALLAQTERALIQHLNPLLNRTLKHCAPRVANTAPVKIKDPIPTTEAARILGVDPSTIRHRVLAGTLAFEKLGRDHYVSRKVIEAERDAKKKNGK